MTVILDSRADLTLDAARRVAWEGEGVELGAGALAAMARGRDRLERILEHDPEVTIYGVTTGAGQHARLKLTPEERAQWAGMSPRASGGSWGNPLPDRVVRAIVLARLANFVEGHAAVSPEVARGVAAMLDAERMPVVPAQGQGGAGEILSLSHLFIGLTERVKPAAKDLMCLINGSPSATRVVSDAARPQSGASDVAPRSFALSFERSTGAATLTPRLEATGTTPMTAGRSAGCGSWSAKAARPEGGPTRRRSATASCRECWARPGAPRSWPPRSPPSRSRP